MAEQKYSESDSSSSDSTMLVKIIQNIIEGDIYSSMSRWRRRWSMKGANLNRGEI